MIFKKTNVIGCFVIKPHLHKDLRGSFNRAFCKREIQKLFKFDVKQTNISFNRKKSTLRGFHYQKKKLEESKIINCISGKIFNCVIDLRKKSKTFLKQFNIELSQKNRLSVIVPPGCANAYLTLENNSTVYYIMNSFYKKGSYDGIRFNDPIVKIKWPIKPKIILSRDLNYKLFKR